MSTLLAPRQVLRLSRAAGTRITVLGGHVWLTQSGSLDDVFLSAGQRFVVEGTGDVVIEAFVPRGQGPVAGLGRVDARVLIEAPERVRAAGHVSAEPA